MSKRGILLHARSRIGVFPSVLVIYFLSFYSPVWADDCVVLLHGMARTERSMSKMEDALVKDRYAVVNYGYPSTELTIEEISRDHIPKALQLCGNYTRVHFVTHSLGGIVVRKYLAENSIENLGRVVMLGPPNKGSEVVDNLKNIPGFALINGPAGSQLGTESSSVPNSLGPVTYEVGVIAGSSTINLLLSLMLPNPDDGKVSVARTKVDGMVDHIVVPVSHPFLMRNANVIQQAKNFLRTGKFVH
ncbi:alpha/beta hydrolase [Gilvimarinus sp. SDUM040013]|uniref:Alpha/beta hydrolase n=1 Tax=Gilvimarinus gilvus TaxID=3058038 RepID=A0ABU4S1C7_9GAMM|nr:alpha/beta hydrolase [Gilvimarinus sp. SDUM040013]MDO3384676.1 alpha/beta hydrolase [Gilvimarinus sp. SDUM040013]MDX6850262.1 alpha/beta hydrolase [Gilvimarinus sp. SDUM040013]